MSSRSKWEKFGQGQFLPSEAIKGEMVHEQNGRLECTLRVLLDGKPRTVGFYWDQGTHKAEAIDRHMQLPHDVFITLRNRAKDAFTHALEETRLRRGGVRVSVKK